MDRFRACAFHVCMVVKAWLGLLMMMGGFKLKNDVNCYFVKVLEEQGLNLGTYTLPPTLFVVVGLFLFLLSIFILFVSYLELRYLYILYSVLTGCTLIIHTSAYALLIIKGDSKGEMARNTMEMAMDMYYNESSAAEDVYVRFWDYFQTNVKCCGVHDYADWALAYQAPEVAFIPTSCCLGENNGVWNCTGAITKDNMNNLSFVERFIYTDGCLAENPERGSILLLEILSGFALVFLTGGVIFGLMQYNSWRNGRVGYEEM